VGQDFQDVVVAQHVVLPSRRTVVDTKMEREKHLVAPAVVQVVV
jgi:hypothetical protein